MIFRVCLRFSYEMRMVEKLPGNQLKLNMDGPLHKVLIGVKAQVTYY